MSARSASSPRSPSPRRRLGLVLVAAGLVTILVAVLYVLETANGAGTGPKSFAARRGYDQVKVAVHRSFPLALLVGLGGLALTMTGARWLGTGAADATEPSAGHGPE